MFARAAQATLATPTPTHPPSYSRTPSPRDHVSPFTSPFASPSPQSRASSHTHPAVPPARTRLWTKIPTPIESDAALATVKALEELLRVWHEYNAALESHTRAGKKLGVAMKGLVSQLDREGGQVASLQPMCELLDCVTQLSLKACGQMSAMHREASLVGLKHSQLVNKEVRQHKAYLATIGKQAEKSEKAFKKASKVMSDGAMAYSGLEHMRDAVVWEVEQATLRHAEALGAAQDEALSKMSHAVTGMVAPLLAYHSGALRCIAERCGEIEYYRAHAALYHGQSDHEPQFHPPRKFFTSNPPENGRSAASEPAEAQARDTAEYPFPRVPLSSPSSSAQTALSISPHHDAPPRRISSSTPSSGPAPAVLSSPIRSPKKQALWIRGMSQPPLHTAFPSRSAPVHSAGTDADRPDPRPRPYPSPARRTVSDLTQQLESLRTASATSRPPPPPRAIPNVHQVASPTGLGRPDNARRVTLPAPFTSPAGPRAMKRVVTDRALPPGSSSSELLPSEVPSALGDAVRHTSTGSPASTSSPPGSLGLVTPSSSGLDLPDTIPPGTKSFSGTAIEVRQPSPSRLPSFSPDLERLVRGFDLQA